MKPFSWADLAVAMQEQAHGTLFYTTQFMGHSFFDGLEDHNYTFCPIFKTPERCSSIFIPFGNKKRGVRIVHVPEHYDKLTKFVEVINQKGYRLNYMCESVGALAYKFLCQLMVRKREHISEETVTKLKAIQESRCGTCGDLLRRYEKHHKKPFCKGGTDDLDNLVLLCPQCHAQ